MATSRRRPFGTSARPLELAEAVARALDKIGHLSEGSAKDQLRKAQGLLYEAERSELDIARIRMAAKLIRETGVSLMKVAAGLSTAAAASPGTKVSDSDA